MLSVITVAIPSTSTAAENGIEMFNIAAAANLARAWQENPNGLHKTTLESGSFCRALWLGAKLLRGRLERGKRNVTFKVLCLSCDGLACDVATITQGLPHLVQAGLFNRQIDRPATARMLGR